MSGSLFAGTGGLGFALGMAWGCRRRLDVDVTLYEAERAPIGFGGGGGIGRGVGTDGDGSRRFGPAGWDWDRVDSLGRVWSGGGGGKNGGGLGGTVGEVDGDVENGVFGGRGGTAGCCCLGGTGDWTCAFGGGGGGGSWKSRYGEGFTGTLLTGGKAGTPAMG